MSEDAQKILEFVAKAYVGAGYPNHKAWSFHAPVERDPVYSELVARGYFQRHGGGTQNFTLTQTGVDWAMEYTDSAQ